MPNNPAMGAATSVAREWNQPPSPPQGVQLPSKGCCRGLNVAALHRTFRLTNMQLNWPSVTSLWWKHSCLVSLVINSYESDGLAQSVNKPQEWITTSSIQVTDPQAWRIWHWPSSDNRVTPSQDSLSGTPAHQLTSQIGSRCCGQL